ARALGTPVVTVGPTRYHDRLAKTAGFARAGVGAPSSRRLVRLLRSESRAHRVEPAARRSLADEIVRLAVPAGRGCPVHHEFGRALWRSAEKSYFACPRCGLVYLERFADDDETYGPEYFMEEYRAQYGKTYLEDFEHIYTMGTRRLDRALDVAREAPETVLDIGCAYGPFLAAARDRGLTAYGLDVAEDAVEYVRTSLGLPAACASILDFSPSDAFGREAFDLVTLWYVIEHFARLDLLLPRLATLVRPGGVLAFSTPYGAGVSARRNTSSFYDASPRDHYSIWNKSSTRRILEEFGFTVRRFEMTGHHPERYPAVRRGIIPRALAAAHSSVFGRGDTFEVYATKERSWTVPS
ncbi:MAG TPA: class I SAM-dependent methyltransferase, partial [Spirochaetia bacterium]|nr:class I SAM-dependent methyltransferase [Spirochaetia bacterium]